MVAAAKAAGKLLMVAHVLPFFPEFQFAAEAIRGGQYGKLLGGALQAGDRASRTGRPTSATRPRPAARPSTCTSTTRTSSAWSCGVPKQVFSVGTVENGRGRRT